MHISVESYEEMYLKDKDEKAVRIEIENIRNQISRLKMRLETPENANEDYRLRPQLSELAVYRRYLESALIRLGELCPGESFLTEDEERAKAIDSVYTEIERVTLYVGTYYQTKHEMRIGDISAMLTKVNLESDVGYYDKIRKDVLAALSEIHFGEWKAKYLPEDYGCSLSEPIRWQVNVAYYGDIAPLKFEGIGVFPFDFELLLKLMEIDLTRF